MFCRPCYVYCVYYVNGVTEGACSRKSGVVGGAGGFAQGCGARRIFDECCVYVVLVRVTVPVTLREDNTEGLWDVSVKATVSRAVTYRDCAMRT